MVVIEDDGPLEEEEDGRTQANLDTEPINSLKKSLKIQHLKPIDLTATQCNELKSTKQHNRLYFTSKPREDKVFSSSDHRDKYDMIKEIMEAGSVAEVRLKRLRK